MTDLFRAAPHIRLHRDRVMVLKVGGACLSRPQLARQLARQVAVVHDLGARVVLVHGGGPQTDAVQRALGEEPRMVDGRRVTSEKALRALRMATAGELAGEVVSTLGAEGVPAVGVSGVSAGLLVARRRPPMVTSQGTVDFGRVGDVVSVDPAPLLTLLEAGQVPVVSPPASDGNGGFLNVNADVAAASLAVGLGAAKLILLTDAPGVLEDLSDPHSLLSALTLARMLELERAGALRGGMNVKSAAIRTALEGGVGRVHVVSGLEPEALLAELYTNHGAGTLITIDPETAPETASAPKEGSREIPADLPLEGAK